MAQKAIDQAGIDISQQSTETKSNCIKIIFYLFHITLHKSTFQKI
jgi:hypothetical protein